MYNIQDVKLSITSAPRWLWHKLSKTSLKAIQLQYQILWSTPLQNILFPKIMGSRGVLIPPRRNRVETGFAAMTTPHNSHKLWHNFILCDSSYWADSDCQDHTNCPHTIQGILWGFSTFWGFWPRLVTGQGVPPGAGSTSQPPGRSGKGAGGHVSLLGVMVDAVVLEISEDQGESGPHLWSRSNRRKGVPGPEHHWWRGASGQTDRPPDTSDWLRPVPGLLVVELDVGDDLGTRGTTKLSRLEDLLAPGNLQEIE